MKIRFRLYHPFQSPIITGQKIHIINIIKYSSFCFEEDIDSPEYIIGIQTLHHYRFYPIKPKLIRVSYMYNLPPNLDDYLYCKFVFNSEFEYNEFKKAYNKNIDYTIIPLDIDNFYIDEILKNPYQIEIKNKLPTVFVLDNFYSSIKQTKEFLKFWYDNFMYQKYNLIFVSPHLTIEENKDNIYYISTNPNYLYALGFKYIFNEIRKRTLSMINLADIVVIPSKFESFSILGLEALYLKKKLIVPEKCGLCDYFKIPKFKEIEDFYYLIPKVLSSSLIDTPNFEQFYSINNVIRYDNLYREVFNDKTT